MGDVLASGTVATSGTPLQAAMLIQNAHRHPVNLWLATVVQCLQVITAHHLAVCRLQSTAEAGFKIQQGLLIGYLVQREHGGVVFYLFAYARRRRFAYARRRRAAYLLSGGVRVG